MVVSQASRGKYFVIGAGYAGLATAIELTRKGFEVEVFESTKEMSAQGDIIQISSSATRVMSKWGEVVKTIQADSAQPPRLHILEKSGRELLTYDLPTAFDGFPVLFSNRGLIQQHIWTYAKSLGIKFHFNTRITSFVEEVDRCGVIVGGDIIYADGIIACDGIHSSARKYIGGPTKTPRTSGFAVYRSWFSLDLLADDPATKHFAASKEDEFYTWLGPDTHVILFTTIAVRGAVVFCTHRDTEEVAESWSAPASLDDMLQVVEGWDPVVAAVMRKIPAEKIIDWKLLWRDPIRQWQSSKGRLVLAGDAAHPHLPTSGMGAASGIEDGATIAAVLDVFGRERTAEAFATFQRLRFERTSLTQRMGWETRHRWHQTDWEAVKRNPEYLKMPQPLWLYCHDAEAYAYEHCAAVAESLKSGAAFESTNLPDGYVHEDWDVAKMMALESKQAEDHFYKVANR